MSGQEERERRHSRTRWAVVGVTGPGVLEDPVMVGPFRSEVAATAARERLDDLDEEMGLACRMLFEVVPVTPARRLPALLRHLRDGGEWWAG